MFDISNWNLFRHTPRKTLDPRLITHTLVVQLLFTNHCTVSMFFSFSSLVNVSGWICSSLFCSHAMSPSPSPLLAAILIIRLCTYYNYTLLLWPPCVADADIIFFACGFFLSSSWFLSSPNLSGCRTGCLSYFHTWCGLSANLEWSEMCCTRLPEIQDTKIPYLDTIAQLCRAISSQLRHLSTIGKK